MDHNNFNIKYDVIKPIIQFFNKYKIDVDGKMNDLKVVNPQLFNHRLAQKTVDYQRQQNESIDLDVIKESTQTDSY